MNRFLGILAVASVISAPAFAADMYVKARPVVPAYNWTGCYIGGNGGWGWGSESSNLAPSGDPVSQAFWNPAFNAGAAPSAFNYNTSGGLGGLQGGCNYQTGMFVVGAEADFDWANIKGSQTINTHVTGFVPGFFNSGETLDTLGTLRGRLGVTPFDRWLFYVTGGLAYGSVNHNLNFAFSGSNDFHTIANSDTKTGWTIGGGAEWAIWSYWTVRAEYLHVDLGSETFTSVPGGRAANLRTTLTETFQDHYDVFRVGVNYKFW
jgi:outer membrane immunogenic protein